MKFNQEFGRIFYKMRMGKLGLSQIPKPIYSLWFDFQYIPELDQESFDCWIKDINKEAPHSIKKISKTDIICGGIKDKIEKLNQIYSNERYDKQEELS